MPQCANISVLLFASIYFFNTLSQDKRMHARGTNTLGVKRDTQPPTFEQASLHSHDTTPKHSASPPPMSSLLFFFFRPFFCWRVLLRRFPSGPRARRRMDSGRIEKFRSASTSTDAARGLGGLVASPTVRNCSYPLNHATGGITPVWPQRL